MLTGKTLALCVTGSVAAYKAAHVARLLVKRGARVEVLLTRSAARFVGEVTFSGITGCAVRSDMWDPTFAGELHVDVATRADAILVVPATADALARMAQGRADDLVTATVLCAAGPVLAAPAMHPRMWAHPATQANVRALAAQGRVDLVGPVEGAVASGDVGMGRMVEPEAFVEAVVAALSGARGGGALAGVHVLVTAGPTYEPLDPVRFLGNRSSGKMGFAIAAEAARRGARVTLVAGPVSLGTPPGVRRVDVETAASMRAAVERALGAGGTGADAVVMAAAVADLRPAAPSASKIKKTSAPRSLVLAPNADILAGLGEARRARGDRLPLLVGFALETGSDGEVLAYAREKLAAKHVDMVVANRADEALGTEASRVWVVGAGGEESVVSGPKGLIASSILDEVAARLAPLTRTDVRE